MFALGKHEFQILIKQNLRDSIVKGGGEESNSNRIEEKKLS